MHFRKGFREKFSELIYITFFEKILRFKEETYYLKQFSFIDVVSKDLTWTTLKKIYSPFYPKDYNKIYINASDFFSNPNIGLKLLLKIINSDRYCFLNRNILSNPHITPKFLEQHLYKKYETHISCDVHHLPLNKHFHLDDLKRFIWKIDPCRYAGKMRNITPEIIEQYSDNDYFMECVAENLNVSLDFILNHPKLRYCSTLHNRIHKDSDWQEDEFDLFRDAPKYSSFFNEFPLEKKIFRCKFYAEYKIKSLSNLNF